VLEMLAIPLPLRAKDADVVLAVAVPIADDRPIVLRAEVRPQVARIELAVAVEIDQPIPFVIHAELRVAIAVEVAGDRNPFRAAEAQAAFAVRVEELPAFFTEGFEFSLRKEGGPQLRAAVGRRIVGRARLASVGHAQVPGVSAGVAAGDGLF